MEALIEYGHALDARTPATSTEREKPSHECSSYATRRKSQSSITSKVHLELQMQAALAWVAAAEGKKNDATAMLRRAADPKTYSVNIPFRPERSFRFANSSALCC